MSLSLPGVADPTAAILLLVASFAGGVIRGFTGFGFAMVFIPAASLAVGPVGAVALIWLIDAPFAFPLALRSFPRATWREVAPLLIGSVIALPFGTFLLTWLDRDIARWIIAISIAAALTALISGWRYHGRPSTRLSVSVGAMSGAYSGLAQLGGMPLAIFWLGSQTKDARQTRDNMQVFFALTTIISGVIFAYAGVLTLNWIWTAIPLAVVYGVGLVIGVKSFSAASERRFRIIAYGVIGASVLLALPIFDSWLR